MLVSAECYLKLNLFLEKIQIKILLTFGVNEFVLYNKLNKILNYFSNNFNILNNININSFEHLYTPYKSAFKNKISIIKEINYGSYGLIVILIILTNLFIFSF